MEVQSQSLAYSRLSSRPRRRKARRPLFGPAWLPRLSRLSRHSRPRLQCRSRPCRSNRHLSIETKTYRKRGANNKITFEGDTILRNRVQLRSDPRSQARACADFIRKLVERNTKRKVQVRSVVLFPEWWVEGKPQAREAWILNPDALDGWLRQEPETLTAEDIALISSAIETHVRGSNSDL